MSRNRKKNIKLFGYCYPVKPAKKLITVNEVFSTDRLIEKLPDGHKWVVSYKANGIRCFLHKKGKVVRLYTDSGNLIPDKKVEPIIEEAQRYFPSGNYIFDGELMLYNHGSPQGHSGIVRYLRLKRDPVAYEKVGIRYKVWDIIYNDEPLTDVPYCERLKILDEFYHRTKHIHKVKMKIVSKAGVKEAVRLVRSREGAIIRACDSLYFDEDLIFKVKQTYEVDVKVIKVERAKNGSYIYTCVDSDNDILGKTYGQKGLKAKVGDIITVKITELRKDGNKFHWYSPIVVTNLSNKYTDGEVDNKAVLNEIYLALKEGENE